MILLWIEKSQLQPHQSQFRYVSLTTYTFYKEAQLSLKNSRKRRAVYLTTSRLLRVICR